MRDYKIFVIIVTYNGMRWYKRCFDSLRMSETRVNIIVIDNNSDDETVEYINNNYPEVVLFRKNENLGFGKANNIGIKYALDSGAEYVFLLNQDAWIFPDTIGLLLSAIVKQPEFGVLSPVHLNNTERELDNKFTMYAKRVGILPKINFVYDAAEKNQVLDIDFVNAAFWFISNACLLKVGGFLPLYPHYGEDNDFVNRVRYHKLLIGIVPQSRAVHDRIQEKDDFFSMTSSRKHNFLYTNCLKFLTNINCSLIKSFIPMLRFLLIMIAKIFLKFKFEDIKYVVQCLKSLKNHFGQIKAARKESKKGGLIYLPLLNKVG